MDPELASFVMKFQNLSNSGKNANLSFTSNAGKVTVNLSVEVGAVKPVLELPTIVPPSCLLTPKGSRISPSRNRRMQRRMETRKLFAEEALHNLSTEEMEVLDAAAEAEKDTIAA